MDKGNIIQAFVDKKINQLRGKKILTNEQKLEILKNLKFDRTKRNIVKIE